MHRVDGVIVDGIFMDPGIAKEFDLPATPSGEGVADSTAQEAGTPELPSTKVVRGLGMRTIWSP